MEENIMSKKPLVKCPRCGQSFDRDECEFEVHSKRYYHKQCYIDMMEDRRITAEIHAKMQKLLGTNYSLYKINKQLATFEQEGKTRQGIKLALDYWYDIKKENTAKANGGIGIVSYIYSEAQKYWEKQKMLDSRNNNMDLSCYDDPVIYKVKPTPIIKPKRVRLFKLD